MKFIVIKDEYKKFYFVLKTPYLGEIYSIAEQVKKRYRIKVFDNIYTQRIFKLFYIKYLIANNYKFRRSVLADFLNYSD